MIDFPKVLERLSAALADNDGKALAALFTEDGVYEDGFYGAYTGRDAITKMMQHFHETATDFRWDFFDPLTDGRLGYARYRFSFISRMPGAEGKPVVAEGVAFFTFRNGLIAHYAEEFDRGAALVQQDFAPERIRRVLAKHAEKQKATPEGKAHLARFKT